MATRNSRAAGALKEDGARYVPTGIDQPDKPMQPAKLFKNGGSQAVRLPKKFRVEGEEVYVKRMPGGVLLSKVDTWASIFEAYALPIPNIQSAA